MSTHDHLTHIIDRLLCMADSKQAAAIRVVPGSREARELCLEGAALLAAVGVVRFEQARAMAETVEEARVA